MSTLLGDARIRVKPDTTGFDTALDRGISSSLKKAAGAAAAAFAAVGIAGFGKDIINLASNAEQSIGGVQAVFKDYAKTVLTSSKQADRALGLSGNSYRELATLIGSQLKNAGVPLDQLGGKTDALISQGADLAAMFGGTTADAVAALSSALKGEMDPIEKYGISLNDAALKAEAASLGLDVMGGTLSTSQRAMAVMSLVTKQGADAVGAFGRESDTAAGRQQRATAQWENLKTTLGEKLLPVWSGLMDFVGTTVLPGLENVGGILTDTVGPAIQGVYDLVVNGDFTGKLAEAFNITEDNPVVGFVLDARDSLLHAWDGLTGLWDGLDVSGLGTRLKDAAIAAGGDLLTGLKTGLDSGDWKPLGQSIVRIVGDALSGLAELAGKVFSAISELIGKVDWMGLALEFGKQVPTLLAGLAIGILNFDLGGLLSGLGDHWFEAIMALVALAFTPVKVVGKVGEILAKIPLVGKFLEWMLLGIKGLVDNIAGFVGDVVGGFVRGFIGEGTKIGGAISGIFENIKTYLYVWGDDAVLWFKSLPGKLVEVAEFLGTQLRQKFDEIMAWLGAIIRSGVDNVVNIFRPITDRLGAVAETARSWVVDKFTRLKDGAVGIFQDIADTVGRIWNGLLDILKQPVRLVIGFINDKIIGNINKVTSHFGLNIPTIPLAFATGGIVPGGYSPGRDNTIAAVGSGEAIMRPEFTKAVGADYIHSANRAARLGGVSGVRAFIAAGGPAFSRGGIVGDIGGPFDFIGDAWSWTTGKVQGLLAKGAGFALKSIVSPAVSWITDNIGNEFVSKLSAGAMNDLIAKVESWGSSKDSEAAAQGGSPGGSGGLDNGWRSIFDAVKAVIPQARQNSTYRPGDPGYHGRGKAVDFGFGSGPGGNGSAGLASINRFLYDNYGSNLAELIYDGLGDDRPDIKNGKNHTYNASTRAGHHNHVHAAVYDQGGLLPPGLTAVHNLSGKPEAVLTNDQLSVLEQIAAGGSGDVHFHLTLDESKSSARDQMEELAFELRRMKRGGLIR